MGKVVTELGRADAYAVQRKVDVMVADLALLAMEFRRAMANRDRVLTLEMGDEFRELLALWDDMTAGRVNGRLNGVLLAHEASQKGPA